ncbi:conserved hypothetical protein [Ferrimonas balearica DSM 9799]|uniref:Tetrahaem cytochrome domain-containing protein n=2 Tax=Ferrimonas balearica TaxID=44012 RepID=E1SUZ2_FERBD|nr:conserved hypothetical protein [Ferrimonas balearica DSM 9799]
MVPTNNKNEWMESMMKYRTPTQWLFALSLMCFSSVTLAQEKGQLDAFHAGMGMSCTDCHGDAQPRQAVPMTKCLECHDTKALAKSTEDTLPTNPHDNRHFSTETNCNYCHHQHQESENYCLGCHLRYEFVVP